MKQNGKKIGIMGGTFDPVHIGHLILAESAREQYRLDSIWVMPNGNPEYKSDRQITHVAHRVEMIRLSLLNNPHMELSLVEAIRPGYTYTCETLRRLTELYPEDTFYFIMGADSLFSFDKWKHPEQIAKNCIMLIANRNQTPMDSLTARVEELKEKYHADIRLIDLPVLDISSEMLRKKVKAGQSIRYYVTDKVEKYIKTENLYRCSEDMT